MVDIGTREEPLKLPIITVCCKTERPRVHRIYAHKHTVKPIALHEAFERADKDKT